MSKAPIPLARSPRQEIAASRRVVVKIGSQRLARSGGGVDHSAIEDIARQVASLKEQGRDVVIVSSGAIASGWPILGFSSRPKGLPELQASAAAGQSSLMHAWERALATYSLRCAQILVTHADLADRRRFLNARETLHVLLERGCVPIINENDTVVVDEIRVGDNDTLSAAIAMLVAADLLIVLTDAPGLMTADPRISKTAARIALVNDIDKEAAPFAGAAGSQDGTGGMATKVAAARKASASGIAMIIAGGPGADLILSAARGDDVGTLFVPREERLAARKHWIAFTLKAKGTLALDAGACDAVSVRGKSLLPGGIREVTGSFQRGESVSLATPAGKEFARGIVAYSAGEVRLIAGHKSAEITDILGFTYGDEIIHRDDLVIL